MKTGVMMLSLLLLTAGSACALPTVDGRVTDGEYSRSIPLMYGDVTVYYQADERGGLYLAVTAPTTGWVGIGLGSAVMDGARIFMGSIKDGTPVFSEQVGEGHSHRPAPDRAADRYALVQEGGKTTLELHVPFEKVPFFEKKVSVIAAFSGSADLTTFHDDNHDGGTIDLSAPE
jgi:hypothetical protein